MLLLRQSDGQQITLDPMRILGEGGEANVRTGTHVLLALEMGLAGWRNFLDGEGVPAEYPASNDRTGRIRCRRAGLGVLASRDRQEIANAITEGSTVDEAEGD